MSKQFKRSYRPRQAAEFLGIGLSTLWRWSKERPDFPKLHRIGQRVTLIDEDDLIAFRNGEAPKVAA